MNFNAKKFEAQLPPFFIQLLKDLLSQGYVPTLVGGAVRDFLRTGNLEKDWDIELTHKTLSFAINEWKALGKSLSKNGRMTFLPYDVIRLEANGFQIEFSPPRIESFEEHLANQGHKNFSARFDFQLPFNEAVKRRDFTINSIGIRFNGPKEIELLDPLEGLRHLREGLLHPAGQDFAKDPVRFLRSIRFSRLFNFSFSPELELILRSMDVSGFSSSYLWSEMQKSKNPVSYLVELINWFRFHPELKLPLGEELLPKVDELKKVLTDPGHHESWLIALEWVGLSTDNWQKYFSLSSETVRRLSRWASQSKAFQKIMPESFHGEFEKIRDEQQFELLFDWYFTTKQLLQKNPNLPLLKMIEEYLPDWIHIYRFEPVRDVKHIDPPYRAKYQVWNLCQRL